MNLQCLFGHADWHRGRNAEGKVCRVCDRCQQPLGVLLSGDVIDTPLPQVIAGTPTGTAQRVRKPNTLKFPAERASER